MTETPETLRASLADIGAQASQVQRNGRAIRDLAEARMAEIDRKLGELRPSTLTNEAAAREYSDLIEERGRLSTVVAL